MAVVLNMSMNTDRDEQIDIQRLARKFNIEARVAQRIRTLDDLREELEERMLIGESADPKDDERTDRDIQRVLTGEGEEVEEEEASPLPLASSVSSLQTQNGHRLKPADVDVDNMARTLYDELFMHPMVPKGAYIVFLEYLGTYQRRNYTFNAIYLTLLSLI